MDLQSIELDEPLTIEEITTLLYDAMDENRKPDASIKRLVEVEDRLMETLLYWSRVNLEVLIDEMYVSFLHSPAQDVQVAAQQFYQVAQTNKEEH
jgi:hypothetical protein